jgi:nanoRNase/pAp phosphatase (c-di-AMP/oligoRNAs hydrolase)
MSENDQASADAVSEKQSRLDTFRAVLSGLKKVVVVTHDYPDPDAMASAAAVHVLLARHFSIQSQLVYSGIVARAENREMLKHMRCRFHAPETLRARAKPLPAIFVDCLPGAANVSVPRFLKPIAIIDHHTSARPIRHPGAYVDIRPDAGSCSAILWEYLAAAEFSTPKWLASCLTYGIATDTMDFTRNFTPLDLNAYVSLLPMANLRILGRIRNAPRSMQYLADFQEAVVAARVYGNIAWSHINNPVEPDIVPEIADHLNQIERVTWSFCTAFNGDDLILSFRTDRSGVRCDKLLRKAFEGDGSSGGHYRMAAGAIPLDGQRQDERLARKDRLTRQLLNLLDKRLASASEPIERLSRPLIEKAREPEDAHPQLPLA